LGTHPYSAATLHSRLSALARALDIRDSVGRSVAVSQTHEFRHTRATSLLNAGVPLHVVMHYFGHASPTMSMHYARTLSETSESEFLRFRKVNTDGRELAIAPSDLFDMLHLSQRADRVLPNGWCMLPPKQACDRGNACLSCGMFATDESPATSSHASSLRPRI
jgi:integrase-like protein